MAVLQSQILTTSPDFRESAKRYEELVHALQEMQQKASAPESPEGIELTRSRKKLLARERLDLLFDPGTARLELAALAGNGMYDGVPPGAGMRTVVGRIKGRTCMVVANDPLVKGGTYFPATIKKHLRAQEIALENHLPCVYLVDSGGAFLPLQAEVFPDRFHFGRIFYNQAQMSSRGIAQVAVVLGSCTAGGAYVPAMSDETIMVRDNATIFLGGPPLVKAATGEIVTPEELGGADVHTRVSGVADHFADSEHQALARARDIIATLPTDRVQHLTPDEVGEEPLYDPKEIYGVVGTDLRKSFPVREVICRLVDGSRFDEFKARYGTSIICGFAHIHGYRVGIIANDGILFSESALKATHFIELCTQRDIPLLFIQNISGFMVGKSYENEGIAKHGAKMVTAVATTHVPKFTLIIGGSFGAGNYAMCGRAYEPRFLFAWPNSRISVMGGAQAANVLTDIRFAKKADSAEAKAYHAQILESYEREGNPNYASARLWDDGVIDPLETRRTLALAFASAKVNSSADSRFGLFRM